MIQNFLELLDGHPIPFVLGPAKQTISIKQKSISWFKVNRRFGKFWLFD